MTFVSNNPIYWSLLTGAHVFGYYVVASSIVVVYDLVLTFGQEFDLIWRQRWSFVTFLYIILRYSGLILCSTQLLMYCTITSVNLTDLGCAIVANMITWISIIDSVVVGAIVIIRLYAMYQQSRIILILLISVYFAVMVPCVIIGSISSRTFQYEELVLSGQYSCTLVADHDDNNLRAVLWVLGTVWEFFTLFLAVWITVKHFRELPTGWTIEDCFAVLIRYHVLYFAAFAAAACLNIGELSPQVKANSMKGFTYIGVVKISVMVEMFVLAPRLILSIRQYSANLVVAESNEMTAVTSIDFQERTQMSNDNGV